MLTDVHGHFEIKTDNEWHYYGQPHLARDQALFDELLKICISGIPEDVSKTTMLHIHNMIPRIEHYSWLDADRIASIMYSTASSIHPHNWGRLFGEPWDSFKTLRTCYPEPIDDIRMIVWFNE